MNRNIFEPLCVTLSTALFDMNANILTILNNVNPKILDPKIANSKIPAPNFLNGSIPTTNSAFSPCNVINMSKIPTNDKIPKN